MSTYANTQFSCGGVTHTYERLSLRELAERIVHLSDQPALTEFHNNRTPFRLHGSQPMRFVEFVETLCDRPQAAQCTNHNQLVLERARDLTIDKFTCLPNGQSGETAPKTKGTDCRHYFQSVLNRMASWRENNPIANRLQGESAATKILQRQVVRSFRLSCMEAKRSCNPARHRYAWHVDSSVIYVWMPTHMPGRKCRTWLEANADTPDPVRPNERERIQAIIDNGLGIPRHVRFENADSYGQVSDIEHDISVHGLAKAVADEKADNLYRQRTSIQELGKKALKKLILRIFQDISDECYEEKGLAEMFGLSRATFSRFAGSRWRMRPSEQPPDLWLNVAQTMAHHTSFIEAAEEIGAWKQIENILNGSGTFQTGRASDA